MPIQIVHSIQDLHHARAQLSGRVALVPTMGALHEGHATLIRLAREHADHVIATVFVNPTQFGPHEDFDAYPRTLDHDAALCEAAGASLLFNPSAAQIYPAGFATSISVPSLTRRLCGPHRPGHFEGVATIVTKLLHLTHPHIAIFGQKDYQQLAVIRRVTNDLHLGVEILGAPTIREADGLAMSSRNRYLTPSQRQAAVGLSRALAHGWAAWQAGERRAEAIEQLGLKLVSSLPDSRVDYVEVVHPDSLDALVPDQGAVMALAVRLGQARLIDNLRLDDALPAQLSAHL
jgi:pantoate--beta-alanine ligase